MKLIFFLFFIASIFSCSAPIPINIKTKVDSVDKVEAKVADSIAKELKAQTFVYTEKRKYSINYDSLENRRLYLSNYIIEDIVKQDTSCEIKIATDGLMGYCILNLKLTRAQADTMNLLDTGKFGIIFNFSRVKKMANDTMPAVVYNLFPKFLIEGSVISIVNKK